MDRSKLTMWLVRLCPYLGALDVLSGEELKYIHHEGHEGREGLPTGYLGQKNIHSAAFRSSDSSLSHPAFSAVRASGRWQDPSPVGLARRLSYPLNLFSR